MAELITFEMKDPRLDFVSVTRVEVSGDLRYAKVFVSHLDATTARPQIIEALDHASGFLRTQLGQRMRLRFVPELAFFFDEGLIASQRMASILDELDLPADEPQSDNPDES